MNFEEYSNRFKLQSLHKTEQSLVFSVEEKGIKKVCKKPRLILDMENELKAYKFVKEKSLINIPEITKYGDNFFEMVFIEGPSPSIKEVIEEISEMYLSTFSLQDFPFHSIDLSKQKLQHRLNYLPEELQKRSFDDKRLIQKAKNFLSCKYEPTNHLCLVHGDLKSPHTIKSRGKIFYLDLALFRESTPWYDLAFLYMEQKNKQQTFLEISSCSKDCFGDNIRISEKDVKNYLKSAIFYRCVYNVIFASRHRNDKSLKRTLNELEEILNT